ncbi:MAG: efflux RND transporter periplasmic adaptor subunit [Parvularculaceae bacterium]|nr:efflux RND transporter periplasmic adaptor subunit [Parvularculaceae bacterium]
MRIKLTPQAVLPLAAAGLFIFAVFSVIRPAQGRADPVIAPPQTPYAASVSGVGVVEPESEIIAIATELSGVIREVLVTPGAKVDAGAPLFRLDARALSAARVEAAANAAAAEASASLAAVNLSDEKKRLAIFEGVTDKRAISVDELDRMRFAVKRAEAALAQAKANAEASEARVGSIDTDLDRLTVKAPIAGEILSVDARPGEYATAGTLAAPLMTIGATDRLHVRVEIDESDIGVVIPGASATGAARGIAGEGTPLTFIRMEPEATPKRALAGGSERVDARVVEVLYALPAGARALVGQRVDVFIEASRASGAVASAAP